MNPGSDNNAWSDSACLVRFSLPGQIQPVFLILNSRKQEAWIRKNIIIKEV
ncbi:Uncharacterized protein dnl_26990 [Desulfonema limicola]|uniref:Uncharacterized protein n=1 Tax=Desulfonema limicola TaxID=45656 RepID=A0A975GGJ3_9BACT|nr:Uncharacterized protein dnl_26990 [Desulfonema limicola]